MKAFAAALGLALLAAQDQPPPKPTFKSAVDLVPVDVNVIDKSGRPVPDLAAGDFTQTVDGKPRRIVSAQFHFGGPRRRQRASLQADGVQLQHQRAGRSPGDDRRRLEHGIGRSRETLPRRTRRLDSRVTPL
jgi:hypothetical protein